MSVRVALHHVTRYAYDRAVELAPHIVRLRPAPHTRTPILSYSLKVFPEKHFLNWQQDPFGNWQARLVFDPPESRELRVEVDLVADLVALNPFDFFVDPAAEKLPIVYDPELAHELGPYLEVRERGTRLDTLLGRIRDDIARPGRRSLDVLIDINQLIQRSLRYDIRMEPGVFTPEETLERGHGSCRDFAWLMVNVLRSLGFAARFVSGYSIQLVADQPPRDGGPAGVNADCTDLHAWAEVYLPGAGFIGFDATSGLACGEGHIPLACSPDPRSAAPITGAFGFEAKHDDDKVKEQFGFDMRVLRIEDRPRPTKPLTADQWRALLACGDEVERELVQNDVRLSMGGEPTFVAADDPEGAEWNMTADGPTKRGYADRLIRRLERCFAPGGMLHHGQGKWYPGEPLPRWAFSCYFRRDGEPLWNDPSLLARDEDRAGHGVREAEQFAKALARRLEIEPGNVQAAFEDVFYYMWRERRLPVNVDPFESRLEDPQERERIRRVFERGLQTEVGYALPLRASVTKSGLRWVSGQWFLRAERMYLLPGDSPMGYRLPLDSLPWSAPEDTEQHFEIDPFAPRGLLPARSTLRLQRVGEALHEADDAARDAKLVPLQSAAGGTAPALRGGASSRGVVRSALCIEPRDGILRVFLPPVAELEAFVELIAAIEDTARVLGLPVQLEGYHPPKDPRLERLQVTPDPGVIEVNIHPTRSWRDLVDVTTVLYAEARECGLSTEKFMIDGRHSGTGGGNHFTLGGATAADSPFLRRPDVLRSLLSYWLDHPSLSYLFSGLFVGPTSQAPRMDEARHDSLYELEIAFETLAAQTQLPGAAEPPPWLVDRLFRHLLIDASGNTHRTEMCIDKLYSPDSSAGRQGLVELRAFEMPPDARMSCAAQLLVRGLVATFWRKPYTRRPTRWGTQLLDRFMLPHFVAQDFRDVLRDLRVAGFAFDSGWYDAQYEFRFPLLGRIAVDGIELELRQAIEPWHVLGEEGGTAGTVRYVDSSVERVQVLARNLVGSRYVVTCNNRRVPMHPTGTSGEFVAGVRYRAWKPATALHPTIEPHTPLVLELLDTWSEHALGGCTYHAVHPGGRAYHVFPHNALEAEARRVSRFWPFGHSLGSRSTPPPEVNRDLPLTLDLRRAPPKSSLM